MPFASSTGYTFDRNSILSNAPKASGVYGIYRPNVWIYVGESGDIQARLLDHLNETGTCIKQQSPTGFTFELVAAAQRVARQDQLILELKPVCNKKLG